MNSLFLGSTDDDRCDGILNMTRDRGSGFLLVPTRTLPGLRMLGNVFYWRIFMKWGDDVHDPLFDEDLQASNTLVFQFIEYFV